MYKKIPPLTRRLVLWPLYTLLGITLILVLLPFIARVSLILSLEMISGGYATVGDIDFNPFTTRLVIDNIALNKAEARVLKIEQLRLKLAGWPGTSKHIEVESLELIGPSLTLEHFGEGVVFVGGLAVPAKEKPEEKPEGKPWTFALGDLTLTNGSILYLESGLNSELAIEKLQIGPLDTRKPEAATRIALHSLFDGTPLTLDATTKPLAAEPEADIDITLEPLRLGRYAKLVRPHISKLSGKIAFNTHIAGRQKEDGTLSINQNGTIELDTFSLTLPEATVNNNRLVWKGQSHMSLPPSSSFAFKVDGELDGSDIDVVMPGMPLKYSQKILDINTTLDGTIEQNGSIRMSQQGNIRLEQLALQHPSADVATALADWQGNSRVILPAGKEATPTVETEGTVSNRELDLKLKDLPLNITQKQTTWQGKFNLADGKSEIAGDAELTGMSTRSSKEEFELLAYEKLALNKIHLTGGTHLDIDSIEIDSLVARIEQIEKGRLRVVEEFARAEKQETAPEPEQSTVTPEQEPSQAELTYQIGKLRIGGKSRFEFIDNTVSPKFTQLVHIKQLEIGTIDSSKPEQSSSLKLDSQLGKYATLKLDGKVFPFARRPTLEVKGNIKSFSLPPISPYAVKTLGYYIHSGQLNTELDLKIDQGIMDGKTTWNIGKLDLELAKQEGDKLGNSLGMPVETALSMVSDNDGNIKLSIPITGDIEDPQFNIQDAINKALAKGVKKGALTYLKYALQPFGAALIAADIAKGLAGGVRLDPITLQVGMSKIGNEHDKYLQKVAGMLNERKQLHIQICGYAVEGDRKKLLEEAVAKAAAEKKKKSSEQAKPAEPPTISDEALLELAKARSETIKGRLVENHQIDPARLFICHPQIDKSEEGKPRVEILI
jgi:hypothetical protein